jgi:WD40 repeat protein
VAFSPDGKTLAAAGIEGIRIWDATTGRETVRLAKNLPNLAAAAFLADGTHLVMGSDKGAIYRWDLKSDKEPQKLFAPRPQDVDWYWLSEDGKTIALSKGKVVRLLDVESHKQLKELDEAQTEVWRPRLSANGKLLVAQERERSVILWDVVTGKVLRRFPEAAAQKEKKSDIPDIVPLEEHVTAYALSPDGKRLAAAYYGENGPVRFWDTATGKELHEVKGSDSAVRSLAFSPDGRRLALSCQNGLRLWEVATGKELWRLPIDGNQLFDITFSPDGKTLAGALISMVRMWDVSTGREICPIPEHRDGIGFVRLSLDGSTVTTEGQALAGVPGSGGPGKDAPSLRYWQARTGMRMVPRRGEEHRFPPLADLSADGKTLVSWGKVNSLHLWDVATGKELNHVTYKGEVSICKLSPDGKILVLGIRERKASVVDDDVRLEVWQVGTGKFLGELEGHHGWVYSVCFSPDGKRLASVGRKDKTVRLWDVNGRKELFKFPLGEIWTWTVAFSPNGLVLAGAGIGDEIRLWDLKLGKEMPKLSNKLVKKKHHSGVYAMIFAPDGKTLITTDNDGRIFFWDVATGELRLEWMAHQFRVSVLAMSNDGKILLSRGGTTALVWDVAELLKGSHPK